MPTDANFFTTPTGIAVISAGASFIAGLLGAGISAWTTRRLHVSQLAADQSLAEQRFAFDISLAERKFLLDARNADRKRKQDLAETVLTGFYQTEAIMRSVRSPMSYLYEADSRPKVTAETESTAKLRDTYYVILARYDKNRKEIGNLLALRYRMTAWFGANADVPFQRLQEAINQVITAAQMLVRWSADADSFRANNLELWQKMEADIWWGAEDPDRVGVLITGAVAAMEAICRPILEEIVAA
ncbi:hypothetical protein M0412_22620 [Agrobacterium sp. O3.4]|uniref:Uncharacterized protein n=1 Tax=Agrobacterium cucumeris TaxID=2862866 RepID=A0ABY8RRF0_9HYPH|nr:MULTISPECIES: hypothetical protein [Rhizobium/Agrobacterium group]MCZ7471905.1 hypothetical protein [Rhizobium rhizogenes]WHO09719.1 hypothetical protein KZ699_14345 [Agrobacterium cucumeris]